MLAFYCTNNIKSFSLNLYVGLGAVISNNLIIASELMKQESSSILIEFRFEIAM